MWLAVNIRRLLHNQEKLISNDLFLFYLFEWLLDIIDLKLWYSFKVSSMKTNHIIIAIGYITVFIIGLYIGQGSPYIPILQIYGNNSMNISDNLSFTQIGIKYKTDKVTDHHYDTMYEKYLREYRGSNVLCLKLVLVVKCHMDQVHQHMYGVNILGLMLQFISLNFSKNVVKNGIIIMESR